ncbi:hypothetical protein BS78_03G258100 [Paspalum vaginatum]|nr:hypothetical protein BS78_03G258100 [Paspalum vaginatum]
MRSSCFTLNDEAQQNKDECQLIVVYLFPCGDHGATKDPISLTSEEIPELAGKVKDLWNLVGLGIHVLTPSQVQRCQILGDELCLVKSWQMNWIH